MTENRISENPFSVLKVWPTDKRSVLDDALLRARLLGDAKQATLAHQQLINLGQRLTFEVNWFPGVTADQREIVTQGLSNGQVARTFLDGLTAIARSNLMLALTQISLQDGETADVDYISLLLTDVVIAWANVSPEEVLRVINDDRKSSGFSLLTSVEPVRQALDSTRHKYRIVLRQALMRLSIEEQSDVLEKILSQGISTPNYRPSPLLIGLVDDFESSAQMEVASARETIGDLVSEINHHIDSDTSEVGLRPKIEELIQAVYIWDSLMQPVQLARQIQVKEHKPTLDLHEELRDTAIRLVNERGFVKLAKRLTDCFADAFKEVRKIVETTKTDIETLEKILKQRTPDNRKDGAWRKAVTWQSQSRSSHLRISPEGIEYGNQHIDLESISRFRLLRDRSIGIQVSGPTKHLNIYFTNSKTLYAFIDRLVTAVADDIHYGWHIAQSEGRRVQVGPIGVTDAGLVITKERIFRGEESYSIPWSRVQLTSGGGGMSFGDVQNGRVSETLSYYAVDNTITLEILVKRLKNGKYKLISDLY